MDVGSLFAAGVQPSEVVQVGEAAFDDPALAAGAGAAVGVAAGDHWLDPPGPAQSAVFVEVGAAVGQQQVWFGAWPADLAGDRAGVEVVEPRGQLGDVVAVGAGQPDRERDPGVAEQVVLGAGAGAID